MMRKLQGKPAIIFVVEKAPETLEDALAMLQEGDGGGTLFALFFDGEQLLPPCCVPETLHQLADKVIFAEAWPPKRLKLLGRDESFAFFSALGASGGGGVVHSQ